MDMEREGTKITNRVLGRDPQNFAGDCYIKLTSPVSKL